MNEILIFNARLILDSDVVTGGVLIRDGLLAQVFKDGEAPTGLSEKNRIDLNGNYLAPGLIDIHIHGSAGIDVQDAEPGELSKLSEFLLSEGVTGYFPTFVPTDERGYQSALASISAHSASQDSGKEKAGARVLGVHFEGPFVSRNKTGALQPRHFRNYDGDPRSIEIFTTEDKAPAHSHGRLMTLAPETRNGLSLIRDLTGKGVKTFIGHSQADPETLDAAHTAGAEHITHFPNALDPLHHRKPGAVAWGLLNNGVTIDCIADFHHVAPLMLQLMRKSKGADKMALISDAIKPAGLGDGQFTVWGDKISVSDGKTSLMEGPSQGTIAGSVITLREAVRNITSIGISLVDAIRMATVIPARVAGIDNRNGAILQGRRADLVAFDEEFNVIRTVVGGLL